MDHPLKKEVKGVDPGITQESLFTQAEAIVAAGGDLEKLYKGDYSPGFIGFAVAWYSNHNLVIKHIEDANTKKRK